MNAPSAEAAEAHVAAQRAAERVLEDVSAGVALPDAISTCVMKCWADYGTPGHVGACRAIQKRLERL